MRLAPRQRPRRPRRHGSGDRPPRRDRRPPVPRRPQGPPRRGLPGRGLALPRRSEQRRPALRPHAPPPPPGRSLEAEGLDAGAAVAARPSAPAVGGGRGARGRPRLRGDGDARRAGAVVRRRGAAPPGARGGGREGAVPRRRGRGAPSAPAPASSGWRTWRTRSTAALRNRETFTANLGGALVASRPDGRVVAPAGAAPSPGSSRARPARCRRGAAFPWH